MLRKPSEVVPDGDEVRLSTDARKDMTALFKTLKVTSSLSSTPKDVTKYVLACYYQKALSVLSGQALIGVH